MGCDIESYRWKFLRDVNQILCAYSAYNPVSNFFRWFNWIMGKKKYDRWNFSYRPTNLCRFISMINQEQYMRIGYFCDNFKISPMSDEFDHTWIQDHDWGSLERLKTCLRYDYHKHLVDWFVKASRKNKYLDFSY